MSDLIWSLATSYLSLTGIGILAAVALIVGHVPLAKYLPVVGPYVVLARFVSYLALMLLAFLIGTRLADERAAVKQLKTDLAYARLQIEAQKASAEAAAKLRAQAEQQAATLEKKVTDYEDQLAKQPEGCGCAFDDGDVNSLRGIAR
ncbi:hypothetical protein [Afipia carboxidovorans]|uniref:hypothetical protein n=1 Tax=Afipia carboxidovorans TaxID=40137 RepID=UPI003089D379|nr:hypothetical protein CRBSH125_21900 [Afipia carboxidovorans]